MARLTLIAAVVALATGPVACASIGARAAIEEAAQTLRAAEMTDAPGAAAYALWSARAYLENARLALGLGDSEGATAMARVARRWGVRAAAPSRRLEPGE